MGIANPQPSVGTWVNRVFQTLTNKTSFASSSDEQWGTEEATLDDALLPTLTSVTVYAQVLGSVLNTSSASTLVVTVEISHDGGSTWSTGRSFPIVRDAAGSNASNVRLVAADHQVTATATGDIQARAVARNATGASSAYDLLNGAIAMEVLVNP